MSNYKEITMAKTLFTIERADHDKLNVEADRIDFNDEGARIILLNGALEEFEVGFIPDATAYYPAPTVQGYIPEEKSGIVLPVLHNLKTQVSGAYLVVSNDDLPNSKIGKVKLKNYLYFGFQEVTMQDATVWKRKTNFTDEWGEWIQVKANAQSSENRPNFPDQTFKTGYPDTSYASGIHNDQK